MTQHFRITLEQAKELHHSGVLNTTTLVFFFFKIKLAADWVGKFINRDIYQELGISESSFYRAIAFLRVQGLLFWKASGVTQYAFNADTLDREDKPLKPSSSKPSLRSETTTPRVDSETPNSDCTTVNIDSPPPKVDSESPRIDSGTPKVESQSPKVDSEKSLEPAPNEASSSPSNLFQIYFNSLSTSLKGLSEDGDELNSFFEWWTAEMANFPQPIRNPIAFLRSIDPNTGQERLVTQWLLWKQGQAPKKPLKRSYNDEWERVMGLSARMSPNQRTEHLISDPRLLRATKEAGGLWRIGMADRDQLPKLKAAFVSSLKEQDVGHDD